MPTKKPKNKKGLKQKQRQKQTTNIVIHIDNSKKTKKVKSSKQPSQSVVHLQSAPQYIPFPFFNERVIEGLGQKQNNNTIKIPETIKEKPKSIEELILQLEEEKRTKVPLAEIPENLEDTPQDLPDENDRPPPIPTKKPKPRPPPIPDTPDSHLDPFQQELAEAVKRQSYKTQFDEMKLACIDRGITIDEIEDSLRDFSTKQYKGKTEALRKLYNKNEAKLKSV